MSKTRDLIVYNRRKPNPALEELRNSIQPPEKLDDLIADLIDKTSPVHAGWLLDKKGFKILQKLCIWLDSTPSLSSGGWEHFGACLGIDIHKLRWIGYNNISLEGKTHTTIWAFAVSRDPSLSKIVMVLRDIGRLDVIKQISDLLFALCDEIRSEQSVEDSGYCSISDCSSESGEYLSEESASRHLIHPPYIPPPPIVLQDVLSKSLPVSPPNEIVREENTYQTATAHHEQERKELSEKEIKYGCIVMLTFAEDGIKFARSIARILRKQREGLPRLGVLILDEHRDKVLGNPNQFISGMFEQVNFVVPVITMGYLEAVRAMENPQQSAMTCTDNIFVKFIYMLMSNYYLRRGCLNDKIRCIIPDSLLHLTQCHPIMRDPIMQIWMKETETDQLAVNLLERNKK